MKLFCQIVKEEVAKMTDEELREFRLTLERERSRRSQTVTNRKLFKR